jgi:hypothetical protein
MEPSYQFDYGALDPAPVDERMQMLMEVLRYLSHLWLEDRRAPEVIFARIVGPTWPDRHIACHLGCSHGEVQRTIADIRRGYPELAKMLDMRPLRSSAQTERRKREASQLMDGAEVEKLADGTEVRLTSWKRLQAKLRA